LKFDNVVEIRSHQVGHKIAIERQSLSLYPIEAF